MSKPRPTSSAPSIADLAREYARTSRRDQGLPEHLEDPATIKQVAELLTPSGDGMEARPRAA